MSFGSLEVSGLLDTGATRTFISHDLLRQVPADKVQHHATADTLQIRLPNGDMVRSEGRVTLEANIEKLQVSFEAHLLNIT